MLYETLQVVSDIARLCSVGIKLRTTPPPAVVRDAAVTCTNEFGQLVLPALAVSRKRVHEHHGSAAATRVVIPETYPGKFRKGHGLTIAPRTAWEKKGREKMTLPLSPGNDGLNPENEVNMLTADVRDNG